MGYISKVEPGDPQHVRYGEAKLKLSNEDSNVRYIYKCHFTHRKIYCLSSNICYPRSGLSWLLWTGKIKIHYFGLILLLGVLFVHANPFLLWLNVKWNVYPANNLTSYVQSFIIYCILLQIARQALLGHLWGKIDRWIFLTFSKYTNRWFNPL